ncbi:MAG: YeeE/YedE family protein [Proteobacteria bacterium]|nr:YeeE/YedE family protein [Pseudomonadota bacterium]
MNFVTATPFTPLAAVAGGALIGLAAVLLFGLVGRIAGISGIVGGLLDRRPAGGRGWRVAFVLGLVAGAALAGAVLGGRFGAPRMGYPPLLLLAGGLLVGYGTALARGCTSGHGVCGLARLSPRSLAAVAVFLATGIATAVLLRHGLALA